jgi:protein-disulfide isomerase
MSYVAAPASLSVPVSARDHTLGPATATLTLLEYGDYECPFCGAAFVEVNQVLSVLGDRLQFAYRHFPLTQAHPHAQQAAESAEAAGAQGRFWEMHGLLFTHQRRLDMDDLVSYAAQLRLDLERFGRELETHAHLPWIREDFMSGVRSGVNGTPTFFVNGVRHDGPADAGSLLAALESAR